MASKTTLDRIRDICRLELRIYGRQLDKFMKYATEDERKAARKESQKRWKRRNREKRNKYAKEWRLKNIERLREIERQASRNANRTARRKSYMREYRRKEYQMDIEAGRERQRKFYQARRERDPEGATKEYFRRSIKRHGMTPERYEELFRSQDFKCAICRTSESGDKRGWQIDHCHDSQRVRGILCRRCNLMLGYALDSVETLSRAAAYIEKTNSPDFEGHAISKVVNKQANRPTIHPSEISISAAKPQSADDLFSI